MQGIWVYEMDQSNLSFPTTKYWKPSAKLSPYRLKKLKKEKKKKKPFNDLEKQSFYKTNVNLWTNPICQKQGSSIL